jgi:glutaredoxin 3
MPSVTIYTRKYCGFCDAAKALLRRKGVEFTEIDATGKAEVRQEMVQRSQGRMTFPQIFIGSTLVGGCDDLYALDGAGRLDALLADQADQGATA